jgi:hypothetical protein
VAINIDTPQGSPASQETKDLVDRMRGEAADPPWDSCSRSPPRLARSSGSSSIETTIPAGMTIADYRRSRPPRSPWWRRLLRGAAG